MRKRWSSEKGYSKISIVVASLAILAAPFGGWLVNAMLAYVLIVLAGSSLMFYVVYFALTENLREWGGWVLFSGIIALLILACGLLGLGSVLR